jgi:HD-like signal output (HDOD) protein
MDGAQLLARVREIQPDTVRIILSGYAEAVRVAQAAPAAHRFLAKPCNVEALGGVIERSCALIDLAKEHHLRRAAVGAAGLPSLPRLYAELTELLADPDTGVREAAAVVERDTAMAGKVLQLANSGFFGIARRVSRVEEAVAFLGLGTLQALTLATQAINAFPNLRPVAGFSVEAVQRRGTLVARLVRELVPNGPARDDALAAALLHDIGIIVLASEEPEYLADILAAAERDGRRAVEIEYERRGFSHAELGAHLLALWDLPHPVIEAVAHHHRPRAAGADVPIAVAALHIADTIARDPEAEAPWRQFDGGDVWPGAGALEDLGVAAHLPRAREIARKDAEEGGACAWSSGAGTRPVGTAHHA